MPRKRDVNLSHCGNAISRMWSPFGWAKNGILTRRGNAAPGHKMFIAAGSDFPRHRRADGQGATRCRALGGGHDDLSNLNTVPDPVFSPNSRYISAISSLRT